MNNNMPIVNQDPTGSGIAFNVKRMKFVRFLDLFGNTLNDGLKLPLTAPAANHKIIGNHGSFADVQQGDVFTLLVCDQISDMPGEFDCFYCTFLLNSAILLPSF